MSKKTTEIIKPRRSSRSPALILSLLLGLSITLRAEEPAEVKDTDTSPLHQALLNYKNANYEAALTAINAAEQANPGDLAIELLKARILTEQHDFPAGEKLLRHLLTPDGPVEVQLALGDLLLRKRDFDGAAKFYELVLQKKPDDSDTTLKLIYARVSNGDLVNAAKSASQLKPFDSTLDPLDPKHPGNPSYYFAKAALAEATGKSQEAEDDIQTVRTLYGITVTNRYLKTYLEVFAANDLNPSSALTPSPSTNAPPANSKP